MKRQFLILILLLIAAAASAQQKPAKPRPHVSRQLAPVDMTVVAVPLLTDAAVVDTFQGRPVYVYAQPMPTYPGGKNGLNMFLARNLRYPAAHLRDQVEGKVFVSFIVDRQGDVHRPGIVKHLTNPCDAEALRVVGLLRRFEPGRRDGQPVDVRYVLPIDFTIR